MKSANYRFAKSGIYAGSRLLSTQVWNGSAETNEFHHPDRLGTRLVTNNATGINYEQSTLPFGTNLAGENVGSINTNQRFTSYDRSASTGIDYAVNRNYSSGQGRFTTVDPIGMASGSITNPQSNNLYSYVENNPIDFTDPSGLNVSFGGFCIEREWVTVDKDNIPTIHYSKECFFTGGGGGQPPTGGDPGTGGGGQTNGLTPDTWVSDPHRALLSSRLSKPISKTCQSALSALKISDDDLGKSLWKVPFKANPSLADGSAVTTISTNVGRRKITTQNGIVDFKYGNMGYLRHELTHDATQKRDKEIYDVINNAGLPIDIRQVQVPIPSSQGIGFRSEDENPPKNQNDKFSNALSDFFNTFCN